MPHVALLLLLLHVLLILLAPKLMSLHHLELATDGHLHKGSQQRKLNGSQQHTVRVGFGHSCSIFCATHTFLIQGPGHVVQAPYGMPQ